MFFFQCYTGVLNGPKDFLTDVVRDFSNGDLLSMRDVQPSIQSCKTLPRLWGAFRESYPLRHVGTTYYAWCFSRSKYSCFHGRARLHRGVN